ncbi:chromate efflux transporter [Paraburkholderia bannensis]|uniref:chromate efflux transporter n=1 Tax=Paraburkholderia bannensis TaxID=765414 RepID=UPI00048810C1|nr:chromate efflux transporter [Paraburkholderia bannensis]
MSLDTPSVPSTREHSTIAVLLVFLKLGISSFGGPIAHIGYFRREFVERRRWLDEHTFSDLVGMCQFLPGPASSQVGFSIGLLKAGWRGGLAAWLGFTLPSVLLMIVFAAAAPDLGGWAGNGALHGLKLVAVAVVAQAVWDMARRLCPDGRRAGIALFAIVMLAVLATAYASVLVIAVGALLGIGLCGGTAAKACEPGAGEVSGWRGSRSVSGMALALYLGLLAGLPVLGASGSEGLRLFDAFYQAGALVFGGGHVVLPLLQQQTVAPGWVSPAAFLAGYGAAQAVPGPLFTFAAFLGWVSQTGPGHWSGAAIAVIGIFLPGLLLVVAALPWWQAMRMRPHVVAALAGVNAAVVGLLAFALYSPVWTSAVRSPVDFAIAASGFVALVKWKAPPLAVVLFCTLAGMAGSALLN